MSLKNQTIETASNVCGIDAPTPSEGEGVTAINNKEIQSTIIILVDP